MPTERLLVGAKQSSVTGIRILGRVLIRSEGWRHDYNDVL